jgi:hypothetical protein
MAYFHPKYGIVKESSDITPNNYESPRIVTHFWEYVMPELKKFNDSLPKPDRKVDLLK